MERGGRFLYSVLSWNGDGTDIAVPAIFDPPAILCRVGGSVCVIHKSARLQLIFAGGKAADHKVGAAGLKGSSGPGVGSLQTVLCLIAIRACIGQILHGKADFPALGREGDDVRTGGNDGKIVDDRRRIRIRARADACDHSSAKPAPDVVIKRRLIMHTFCQRAIGVARYHDHGE